MRPLDYSLDEARTFLAEGSPGAADVVLWTILGKNPRDAEAWALLGQLAAGIGDADAADRYTGAARALKGEPPLTSAASPRPPVSADDRYLIIKAWGYGFCSDLDHAVSGLLLAEMSGRTPVTYWGSNSLFSVDPQRDAFREYFEPVSPVRLDDVIAESSDDDFWPPKWTRDTLHLERLQKQEGPYSRLAGVQLLNRPERVVVADYHLSTMTLLPWIKPGHPMFGRDIETVLRYLFARYIRPLPDIRDEVGSFVAQHFKARPVIGVHIRGSDKYKEEPQLQQKQALYPQAIDFFAQRSPNCPIFLITDAEQIVKDYQQRYGSRLIVPPAVRSSTIIGVHHLGYADKRAIGREVVRDIYLAAQCDMFIGLGTSNVSATINHLKPWPPGSTHFFGQIMTHRSDPYQYLQFSQLERYFGEEWGARMRQILV